jgi:alkylation response protein AidB-like acyl-CoA dehydrogenase
MTDDATARSGVSLRQSSLVDAARAMTPFLNEQAPLSEAAGRLTDATIQALRDAGLMGFYMPKCFGGAEVWPLEALEIIEALSYADASTSWVTMAAQVSMATAAAYLPPSAARHVFGATMPIVAGQGAPFGRADMTEGGFRLSGKWGYGSGLYHAAWTHTGAMVHEHGRPRIVPGTETPDARIFIVPIGEAEFQDNWDVLGLRATGSVDYAMQDVFVPEEFTHRQNANRPYQGGDLYRLGISGLSTSGHTGFALGVARRALDEIATLAVAPRRPAMIPDVGGGEVFHQLYGQAEADLRAARSFVFDAWADVQAQLQRGDDMTVRQMTLVRMALNHVTSVAARATEFAYKYGGGSAARAGALQRCFRDMATATQHVTVSPWILRECAKELLGLSKGKVWGSRAMVKPAQMVRPTVVTAS